MDNEQVDVKATAREKLNPEISEAFIPGIGTVRACINCGVLIAGGPTRCMRCVDEMRDVPCPYKYGLSNPVVEHKNRWYWWDETWTSVYGPYCTAEEARRDLDKYIAHISKEKENEDNTDSS